MPVTVGMPFCVINKSSVVTILSKTISARRVGGQDENKCIVKERDRRRMKQKMKDNKGYAT